MSASVAAVAQSCKKNGEALVALPVQFVVPGYAVLNPGPRSARAPLGSAHHDCIMAQ